MLVCQWWMGLGLPRALLATSGENATSLWFVLKTPFCLEQNTIHSLQVVDYRYLVFVIFFTTIILPSAVIAYCYAAIYAHIRSEEHQIKCLLRASERQRRINTRRKLIRILLILVLTYAICWYPLYLINTADLFLPPQFHAGRTITLAAVVLSHLNCALNPLIYAYGVKNF